MKASYALIKEFQNGMQAGMFLLDSGDTEQTRHWHAGWDVGWRLKKIKNELTDDYLLSKGFDKQTPVKLTSIE